MSYSFASHVQAGEILFCTDDGLTYYFTVIIYTEPNSCAADACELEIKYGDGTSATIQRVNGNPCPVPASCSNQQPDCDHCGELILNSNKKNVYTSTHTYSGPGTFTVSVFEQNRNDAILNIPNSLGTSFYVENEIIISPFSGINCNPELTFPPIDNGCIGIPYQHNPGAVDPEGDSLAYSLIKCSSDNNQIIPGYQFPDQVSGIASDLYVDEFGTVYWDSPSIRGYYNICILIEEYRDGVFVGSVVRDMQLYIENCPINEPPVVDVVDEICVLAGDTINEEVKVTDPNFDLISLTSEGEAYGLNNSPAIFNSIDNFAPLSTLLQWPTTCDHVRLNPYQFYFKAYDNQGLQGLTDFGNLYVNVIAPAPENAQATAIGNNIIVDWDESLCANASCYQVYRKIDSLGYSPDSCITGVPSETGYELISTINGWSNSIFTDNNNGNGLDYGKKYCYMIVACFDDGAESYPSQEVCSELKRDVPIITRVSVNTTSTTTGKDTVMWSRPTEIDTIEWSGPYFYNVYRDGSYVGATSANNSLIFADTIFVDSLLNTEEVQYYYTIEVVSGQDTIGSSQKASSVFLQSSPTDNQLDLVWNENVPWTNEKYVVYRKVNNIFIVLDTVDVQQYTDTGLVNEVEYCYYVKSIGDYSVSGLINPIYNNSQVHCNTPTDNVAPCPPFSFVAEETCDEYRVDMSWGNPNDLCADDVVGYNIYFGATDTSALQLYDTIRNAQIVNYVKIDTNSIAGCYAVTAIDTFNNESIIDTFFCVDNCPIYNLPLVFSPGGDGFNDLFHPFPYRYIQDIEITIYNRWGVKIFNTTDKDILWDGYKQSNGAECVEGVYYYVGYVNEIRLSGIVQRDFKGYVHLIWEE